MINFGLKAPIFGGTQIPHSMRRRDFLIAAAASGAAYLGMPSARAFGRGQAASPDPNFHVFLAFGQSNMEGFPGIEDQDKTGVDPRFRMLAAVDFADLGRRKGEWYTASPPLCRSSTGLCPADYFGRTLVARMPARVTVGVINVAVAGCKIELFDKDTYQSYAGTVASWMTNIITQYGGNPYQRLVDMGKLAQQKGVIKGILLHQGESNTNDTKWPAKVGKIYHDLITDLNLDAGKVPLLAGETVNADQQGATASMNTIIAELPKVVPNSYVISSKGCGCRSDRLHFTPAGYRDFGRRYAETMLQLV
jgi:Carbohydrate esterase, sialic acid-specific acetylesterase